MGGKRVIGGRKPRSIGDLSKSIADVDFSFLISHLVHVNGFSWIASKELVVELLRYLMIKVCIGEVVEHGTLTAPSHAINTVWQVFLLFSVQYHEVCRRLVEGPNYYIHYHPLHGDKATLTSRYTSTCLAYKCTFGVEPNKAYWPQVESTGGVSQKKTFKLIPSSLKVNLPDPHTKVQQVKEDVPAADLYSKWCSNNKQQLEQYGFNLGVHMDGMEDISVVVTPEMPSFLLYNVLAEKLGVAQSKLKISSKVGNIAQDVKLCDGGVKPGENVDVLVI